jgi:hypothetical protein
MPERNRDIRSTPTMTTLTNSPAGAPPKARPAARLHVILAREAPLAVVVRRGPAKEVCTLLWNRRTDEFTLGQWLRGRIYEDRCDLSPDGRYFIYFAYDGRPHREHGPSWTAISRAPWLKAIALYAKGSTWGGGGYFTGARTYWLDSDHRCVQDTTEVRRDLGAVYPQIWHARWAEAGWQFREALDAKGAKRAFREKALPRGWMLRLRFWESCYELEHVPSKLIKTFPRWGWAEWDRHRLVWAERGCLFAASLDREQGVGPPTMLHDFNSLRFEARVAPY